MIGLAFVFRRALPAVVLLCAASIGLAHAEDTVLKLAETATVMAAPDELGVSLRAEAIAPTAQDAQKRVNETMRDALATAKKTEGITVSTGGYGVWRTSPTPLDRTERWQAGQSLNLTGKDGETVLRLVGDLQQKGLIQGNLGWRLSDEAERTARKAATKQALLGLRGRADEAAGLLGLRFDSFREVRLDSVSPPLTAPRMMVTRSALATTPPPSTEAEDLPVSASAEADVILKAR
jgi:predicted secreted protein